MAGVDHAYQYSVEVKSRFSLFLDDNLNNEDPDLLILKLKQEKSKKDKSASKSESKPEANHVEKPKDSATKSLEMKSVSPMAVAAESKPIDPEVPHQAHTTPRGRGEGAPRVFRGRGRGHYNHQVVTDPTGDGESQGPSGELRGRGRGRGRFFRGRGHAYTDYRELHNPERGPLRTGYQGDDRVADHQDFDHSEAAVEHNEVSEPPLEDGPESPNKDEVVEEEPKTYTLEEYKAMRSSSKPVVTLATKGTRKANDGKDVFKNMVEHRKVTEDKENREYVVDHVDKEPPTEEKYEINVTFTDRLNERDKPSRGFGGRGSARGRGAQGFRGGRGRGGPRSGFRGSRGFGRGGNLEHKAAPVIYSDQDFPSLK